MVNITDKEHYLLMMEINIMENSKMVILMVMEFELIQMDINIKVYGKMIKNKEKDNIS